MGYRFSHLDEPVFIAVSNSMLTELGIHYRLESCGRDSSVFLSVIKPDCVLPLTVWSVLLA